MPPNVEPQWDDNDVITQAELIAYDQIRGYEEMEIIAKTQIRL